MNYQIKTENARFADGSKSSDVMQPIYGPPLVQVMHEGVVRPIASSEPLYILDVRFTDATVKSSRLIGNRINADIGSNTKSSYISTIKQNLGKHKFILTSSSSSIAVTPGIAEIIKNLNHNKQMIGIEYEI